MTSPVFRQVVEKKDEETRRNGHGVIEPVSERPVSLTDASLPHTDLGNARRLCYHFGEDLRFAPQLGIWMFYDGLAWREDVTGKVHPYAKSVIDGLIDVAKTLPQDSRSSLLKHYLRSQASTRLRAMVEVASTEPGIPVVIEDLDSDPWSLNVNNGTIDLRTGDLRPHDRYALHTKLVPIDFDPTQRPRRGPGSSRRCSPATAS
jgi:putative DNA primase/helicase